MRYKKNIKSIAKIQAGYTFRTALKTVERGENFVVQARDINGGLYINDNKLDKIDHQIIKSNALVKKNDVIISVRGKFRSGVYRGDLNNIIASSSVYILRLFDKSIYPEYLSIFLNSNNGQKEIRKSLTGGAIKTILRKDLENLNIIIPEAKKQKTIIDLYKNNSRLQEKLDIKKYLINNIAKIAISKILNK